MENENIIDNEYEIINPQNLVSVFTNKMNFEDLNESEQASYSIFMLGIEIGTNMGMYQAMNGLEQGLQNLRDNEANERKIIDTSKDETSEE